MSTVITEVYEAFTIAGVPEEKAKEAAEAVVNKNDRLTAIEVKLNINQWIISGVGFGVLILVIQLFVN